MEVTMDDLQLIIGRLTVEVEVLRAQLQLKSEREKNGHKNVPQLLRDAGAKE